jgi:hypothetical protein
MGVIVLSQYYGGYMFGFRSGWRDSCRGDEIQIPESCAFECVPSGVATDPLTLVS